MSERRAGNRTEAAQDMIADTIETAKGVARQTRAAAADIGEFGQEMVRQAADRAGAAVESLSVQSALARDGLAHKVVQNPLASLLIAGAVGYAVAVLVHRR